MNHDYSCPVNEARRMKNVGFLTSGALHPHPLFYTFLYRRIVVHPRLYQKPEPVASSWRINYCALSSATFNADFHPSRLYIYACMYVVSSKRTSRRTSRTSQFRTRSLHGLEQGIVQFTRGRDSVGGLACISVQEFISNKHVRPRTIRRRIHDGQHGEPLDPKTTQLKRHVPSIFLRIAEVQRIQLATKCVSGYKWCARTYRSSRKLSTSPSSSAGSFWDAVSKVVIEGSQDSREITENDLKVINEKVIAVLRIV
jgi:hypothetical protein